MKKLKLNKEKVLIIISILIALLCTVFVVNKTNFINNGFKIEIKKENEEILPLFSYIIYDNQDTQKIKILITINSENGIEYIEEANGNKIETNGKNKASIDYIVEKDVEQTFKIKEKNKEEKEEKVLVTDDVIANTVKIEKISENTGYKTIKISSNVNLEGFKTYYQIGKNGEWQEGSGKISILDYDVTANNLINEDNTVTISAISKNEKTSDIVTTFSKNFEVDTTATLASFEADSLLDAMEKYDFGTGIFKVTVSNETYNLHVYSLEESEEFEADTTFGTEADVATSSTYAQNMIVLKVNGDLTINENITLTSYASISGYGGPKGMMIYCTGTLTNNGTISMTERGAKAEGQNVYLWKNEDGSYEYVPATGASGASSATSWRAVGNKGNNGTNRETGGGASGASAYGQASGKGASGTSYSGGTGGGGSYGPAAYSGEENGGKGGNGTRYNSSGSENSGGGAGNPGGNGIFSYWDGVSGNGENGTGGLLIIYANNIINNGSIKSNGSKGGLANAGGGSSGGGSINIFYKGRYDNNGIGIINTDGGQSNGNYLKGGTGGTGSISVGNISTGTYVSTYTNY